MRIPAFSTLSAVQKVFQQRLDAYGHDDPFVGCLPEGPRASLAGLEPLRIIQTPAKTCTKPFTINVPVTFVTDG